MSFLNIFTKKEPVQLPFATDMHCHILPGVDDGSPDVETSVALVGRMMRWGIERIFASPHVTESTFENTPDILDPALDELRQALATKGMDIPVDRSSENRIDDYSMALLKQGQLKLLPGGHILVECSFLQEPWMLDQFLYELKVAGMKPILAHPERYSYYFGNKGRYEELHRSGTLFQVNVLSLADAYHGDEKKTAEWFIAHDMVDFLGTDLHNMRHADAIDAYLCTRAARRHAEALRGRLLNDTALS